MHFDLRIRTFCPQVVLFFDRGDITFLHVLQSIANSFPRQLVLICDIETIFTTAQRVLNLGTKQTNKE